MSITLTPITKGMEKGAETIDANFDSIGAAMTDTGIVDAAQYLADKFTPYSGVTVRYRKRGDKVKFYGVVTPTEDMPVGDVVILTGLPFTFVTDQFAICPGTNGAYFRLTGQGSNLVVSRYMYDNYADAHKVPVTITKGNWLGIGGSEFDTTD